MHFIATCWPGPRSTASSWCIQPAAMHVHIQQTIRLPMSYISVHCCSKSVPISGPRHPSLKVSGGLATQMLYYGAPLKDPVVASQN
jgi:hypothetical protein